MEVAGDVVIVGGGVAGLATSLGLHRLGIRSLVLESSDDLRSAGYALTAFTNAWKALDALGIGNFMRQHHKRLNGNLTTSTISGLQTSELSFEAKGKQGDHEVRCVSRKLLLEALAKELPIGNIRYSSKVVCIEESGFFKLVHLADGTILKTKVLIGCDGVNSVVARWLGFKKPAFAGRFAIRGCVDFKGSHGFEPKFMQFFGTGIRSGAIPVDDSTVYWYVTWTPSNKEEEQEQDPAKIKQLVLSRLGKVPDQVRALIENYELEGFVPLPLRYRHPWELLWGNISKGNVCVAGDALHPMTADMGQGACSALEDSVVLARCLAEALLQEPNGKTKEQCEEGKEENKRIELGLKKYAKERTWRSIEIISVSYIAGFIQESSGKMMTLMRDKALAGFLSGFLLKIPDFDCGKLTIS
ncbi:3-hydroxybenzoate 6-hydroxylase 1 [Morella rubra]|uniref:3-hydroxybenzoate 6-hydroxylase 1 n=1 Tax=Morella rubra TaxID=262757 RepID=A0A6A1V4C1_9ROSI|nr:3-hydroxybenzoate 6-hydroxylase 1 [Morella rubra]